MESKFNNSGNGPLQVPGFGLPIDYWPGEGHTKRFRHGANDFRAQRMTVKEVSMLSMMNTITDKPEWNQKVYDDSIIEKWRQETQKNPLMSREAFNWCISELRDKAKAYEKSSYVKTLDSNAVCVKSDTLISSELQDQVKTAVKDLLLSSDKDWHPNSNEQVLNLVHPSLFPLVYGRTHVLTTGLVGVENCFDTTGKGDIVPGNGEVQTEVDGPGQYSTLDNTKRWSTRFQWLPCEVKFLGDKGDEVQIASYINNLHPRQHAPIYDVIEKLISASIQPWNENLIRGLSGRIPLRILTYGADLDPEAVPEWSKDIKEIPPKDSELYRKINDYLALPDDPANVEYHDNEEYHGYLQSWREDTDIEGSEIPWLIEYKWERIRKAIHPEPGLSYTYSDWKNGDAYSAVIPPTGWKEVNTKPHKYYSINIEEEFRQQGLQVIVKLASIELTPSNPTYEGGNWHLEGMLNEHIVATSIYYYDVDNVSESRIRFRQEAELDELSLVYEQSQHQHLCTVFGTESMGNEPAVQEIGSIATPQGRLLTFPNTLQHRVEPFHLIDPTLPGHRRFIVMWLVDPHMRILSTANVPPQQHEWWAEETARTSGIAAKLPPEVTKMVLDEASDWPMSLEEAKKYRLELMEERTVFRDQVELNIDEYNLCEH